MGKLSDRRNLRQKYLIAKFNDDDKNYMQKEKEYAKGVKSSRLFFTGNNIFWLDSRLFHRFMLGCV